MLESYRDFFQRLNLQNLLEYIQNGDSMIAGFDHGEPDKRCEAAFDEFDNNLEDWQEKIKAGFFSNCSEKELQNKLIDFNNSLHESISDIESAEFSLGFLAGFTVCNQINDSTRSMYLACFTPKSLNFDG